MSRPLRLIQLLDLLGAPRERSVQEIAERFEVTERTVYRDLQELQEQRIPLVRGEHGYRLVEGSTLRPLNLTAAERAVLKVALSNPALRNNPALAQQLAPLVDKLDNVTRFVEESTEALIAGPERSGEPAPEVSLQLQMAVRERRTVRAEYTSLTTPGTRWRRIDPYGTFHRADVWYVAGRCHTNDEMRIFRLDRISSVELGSDRFEPPSLDLEQYLADSWAVFLGNQEHVVRLEVEPELAPLFRAGRHHPGEKVEERADGSALYTVTLTHLEEIARFVLGFGGRVRVVGPDELRERVRELAEGALRRSDSSSY